MSVSVGFLQLNKPVQCSLSIQLDQVLTKSKYMLGQILHSIEQDSSIH